MDPALFYLAAFVFNSIELLTDAAPFLVQGATVEVNFALEISLAAAA